MTDDVSRQTVEPQVGHEYNDGNDRVLRVHSVRVGDRLGREVLGTVRRENGPERNYSTTLELFQAIWIDHINRPDEPPPAHNIGEQ